MNLEEILKEAFSETEFTEPYQELGSKKLRVVLSAMRTVYEKTLELAAGEWVSVEEGLPVIWGDYIVTSGNWVGSCHFDGQFYDYSVNNMKRESRYVIPVTAWRKLPKTPSEILALKEKI